MEQENHKYIMFGGYIPIVFPNFLTHDKVAKAMGPIVRCGEGVTSAGFFKIITEPKLHVVVFGKSLSLKLGTQKTDAHWIEKILFGK